MRGKAIDTVNYKMVKGRVCVCVCTIITIFISECNVSVMIYSMQVQNTTIHRGSGIYGILEKRVRARSECLWRVCVRTSYVHKTAYGQLPIRIGRLCRYRRHRRHRQCCCHRHRFLSHPEYRLFARRAHTTHIHPKQFFNCCNNTYIKTALFFFIFFFLLKMYS